MTTLLIAAALGILLLIAISAFCFWWAGSFFSVARNSVLRATTLAATLFVFHLVVFVSGAWAVEKLHPISASALLGGTLVLLCVEWGIAWLIVRAVLAVGYGKALLVLITASLPAAFGGIVLAFFIRMYVAEAFVIPTGAMAKTLIGWHKDVECPQCGYRWPASASTEQSAYAAEMEARLGAAHSDQERRMIETRLREFDIIACVCPMCRFPAPTDPNSLSGGIWTDEEHAQGAKYVSRDGDRVFVSKHSRAAPRRWDVIVFRFPGDERVNYVKRLVGLPGETIRMYQGDLFASTDSEPPTILRKPPSIARSLMTLVDDTKFRSRELAKAGWPARWQPTSAEEGWSIAAETTNGEDAVLATIRPTEIEAWLRYRHIVPSQDDWQAIRSGAAPDKTSLQPQLISDFLDYNASYSGGEFFSPRRPLGADKLGVHWVGDLMIECDATVEEVAGQLVLDLVEAGEHFPCRFDFAAGKVELMLPDGEDRITATATAPIAAPGRYRLALANVDDQLLVWVNDELVSFDRPTTYESGERLTPVTSEEDPGDLAPAGVAAKGVSAIVHRLRLYRDVYYIAVNDNLRFGMSDLPADTVASPSDGPIALLVEPEHWQAFAERSEAEYPLDEDQFFFLGDNSAFSKDGRLWPQEGLPHYVTRDALIGPALWIYHPFQRQRSLP